MGYTLCSVPGCRIKERPHFRFPHPQMGKERFQRWLNIINSPKLNGQDPKKIYANMRVCAKHFGPECFLKPNKLKFSAIPTLFVAAPEAAKGWNYSETKDYQPSRIEPSPVEYPECEDEDVDGTKLHDIDVEHNYTSRVPTQCIRTRCTPAEPLSTKRSCHRLYKQQIGNQSLESWCDNRDAIVELVCRVCLVKTESGVPLNYTTIIQGEESRTLSEIIDVCCNVKVCLDDNKPQSICIDCAEKARAAYEFRKCCLKSDVVLRNGDKINGTESDVIVDAGEFENQEKIYTDPNLPINSPTKKPTAVQRGPENSTKLQCNKPTIQCDKSTNVKTLKLLKKCTQCRKPYPKSTANPREWKTVCLQCSRNFKKQAEFKACVRKKRHRCVRCEARFSNPRNLRLHKATHYSLLYKLLSKKTSRV